MTKTPPPEPKKDADAKEPWVTPKVVDLPRLADLTLQTTIEGFGGTGGGGSTVF